VSLADPIASTDFAGSRRFRVHSQVAVSLVAVGVAVIAFTGFVSLAANRLVSGHPVMLWNAAPPALTAVMALLAAMLLVLTAVRPCVLVHRLSALAAALLLIAIIAAAGEAAARLTEGGPALPTVSFGPGFWVSLGCAALALVDALQRARAGAALQLFVVAALLASFVAMAEAGVFDALSLAREYANRGDVFAAALGRHIMLVVGSIVPALLIGVPLGLAALRHKRAEEPIFATLNLLQTVPSIALFGLLIVPLSALGEAVPSLGALGIGGVGPAPAVIALTLYALLPIARNTLAGIGGVSPAAIDAGRGMGMTRRQLFWHVEAPLALPVLLAGLRIVLVQTIGLAVIAALIGAGGLGTFVFDGLGQYATNLVLLGALPAILLALGVDFLLRLATAGLRGRFAP